MDRMRRDDSFRTMNPETSRPGLTVLVILCLIDNIIDTVFDGIF